MLAASSMIRFPDCVNFLVADSKRPTCDMRAKIKTAKSISLPVPLRRPMRPIHLAAVLLLSTATALAQSTLTELNALADGAGDAAVPTEPKAPRSLDVSLIDRTANPCTDFYQYACGNWIKNNPIPADQVRWGTFNELSERNMYTEYKELSAAAKPGPSRTELEAKFGDFFGACMDKTLADEKGIQPLDPVLQAIDGLGSKGELASLLAKLTVTHTTAAPDFFDFGVEQDQKDSSKQIAGISQGGLGLPDRDYYLEQGDRQKKIREQYVAHITAMFQLAGDTPEKAAAEAKSVMDIETAFAKASMARTDMRDPKNVYHIMTVDELKTLAPNFDWHAYFSQIGIGPFTTLNVSTPDFFKAASQEIQDQDLSAWKSYLRWHAIHDAAPYLSSNFIDENFKFYGMELAGQKEITPRWKRCTRLTDRNLGEAVGQDWVKKYFPPQDKESMQKLVAALDKALGEDIAQLPWMSDATKKEAEAKLALFRNKIGYPDHWRDYSSVKVTPDAFLADLDQTRHFAVQHDFKKLGQPVDETEWGMTPPTVNAYYNPSMNDINFPAGILQPPFYDFSEDPAVNFGGIGVVIGHEMTHGFDDEGSQYDGKGNVREWQTPEDRKAFTARTDCEVKEYGGFETAPGQDLNGKLTLGENTADNGGLRISYLALMNTLKAEGKDPDTMPKIDGFTPQQRFFLSFAQIWCSNQTEQSARMMAKVDPHSPGKFRTNGSVQNFDEFGKAFSCKQGTPMYPASSCRVW
jgi:putative endopeptidase